METTTTKRLYEAMFLVDSAQAGSDWDGTMAVINRVLERAEAEVVALRKWADRKLAYEIDHKTRGTYILCFFKAVPSKISGMEKDVQLSEKIMRAMITSTEGRSENVLNKDISGETPAPKDQEYDSSRDRNDRSDRVRSVRKSDVETTPKAKAETSEASPEKAEAETSEASPEKVEAGASEASAEKAEAGTSEASSDEDKTAEETPAS